MCYDLEEGGLKSQRPSSLLAQAPGSYRDMEERAFFLSHYIANFWRTNVRTSHCAILANWGDFGTP